MVHQPSTTTRSGAGPTDAALVVAARAGEKWAQEALYQRYARLVIGLAHRILAGREEADDLAQDAFVYAFSRLDTLENPQAFSAWVSSIVVRTASKRLRRHRLMVRVGLKRNEPLDTESLISPGAPQDVRAELHAVYDILQSLPAEERVALILRRVEGMELSEISDQMGLSLATVKRRIAAANARIVRAKERM